MELCILESTKGIQKKGLSLKITCRGFQKHKKHILKNYKWFGPYKILPNNIISLITMDKFDPNLYLSM
jgi:hypothetical protein